MRIHNSAQRRDRHLKRRNLRKTNKRGYLYDRDAIDEDLDFILAGGTSDG